MTAKITSKPITEGIKTLQGLKLATGGGNGSCSRSGSRKFGLVTLRRTRVSSSASSLNSFAEDLVGELTRLMLAADKAGTGSMPAAIVKSSINSFTVL